MSERRKVSNNPNNQIVGNNALTLDVDYDDVNHRAKKNSNSDNVYRFEPRFDANYAKINMLCTFVLAFVIIATLGVCVVFLKTQFSYSEINTKIETVKRELKTMKRENVQLEEDLNAMIDLEEIYFVATTRLNMRLPGPEDVYYIDSNPITYTTKYGPIKVENEETSLGSVLAYITKGW